VEAEGSAQAVGIWAGGAGSTAAEAEATGGSVEGAAKGAAEAALAGSAFDLEAPPQERTWAATGATAARRRGRRRAVTRAA
jgi:hypothetical protein